MLPPVMTPVEARMCAEAIRAHSAQGHFVPHRELRWLDEWECEQRVLPPDQTTAPGGQG